MSRLGLERDNTRIFWGIICDEVTFAVTITLLPLYVAALGASPTQIGVTLGVNGFAKVAWLTLSGVLSDRVPPRRLIVGTRVVSMAGLLIVALAQAWWQSLIGLLVVSSTAASYPTISRLIAGDSHRGRERMRAFTLIYTVAPSISLLAAPAGGGMLAEAVGLASVFIAAALFKLGALLIYLTLSDRPVSASGYAGSIGDVVWDGAIRIVCILLFVTIFVLTTGLTLVPNFLEDVHAIRYDEIGWLSSLSAIGSIVVAIAVSRVKIFQQPQSILPFAVGAVGLAFLLLLLGQSLWLFAIAFLLRGGYFVAWSLFYAVLGDITPEWLRTRVYMVTEILGVSGFALAPFVAGWFYGFDPALPLTLGLVATVPLLAGLVWLRDAIASDEPDPESLEEATTSSRSNPIRENGPTP